MYAVKLGFTGIYIIFLISRWGGSNEYPLSMFWAEIWEISEFYLKIFTFCWRNFQYIYYGLFHNGAIYFMQGGLYVVYKKE